MAITKGDLQDAGRAAASYRQIAAKANAVPCKSPPSSPAPTVSDSELRKGIRGFTPPQLDNEVRRPFQRVMSTTMDKMTIGMHKDLTFAELVGDNDYSSYRHWALVNTTKGSSEGLRQGASAFEQTNYIDSMGDLRDRFSHAIVFSRKKGQQGAGSSSSVTPTAPPLAASTTPMPIDEDEAGIQELINASYLMMTCDRALYQKAARRLEFMGQDQMPFARFLDEVHGLRFYVS